VKPAAQTIETPRLTLRPFTEADAAAYAAMCADPEVMRFIGSGAVQTAAEAWRALAVFLGHWQLRGFGMWALEHRGSGVLLGRVGFHHPPDWPDFELGWLLGREHWGHGYAREAAAAALRHAFAQMRRERVISLIRPANLRSIAVAEAIGERPAGRVDLLGGEALVYEARAAAPPG
jgi:RimJ/RimL family protein N-acetyltransferase